MKTKSLYLASVAALSLCACSSVDEPATDPVTTPAETPAVSATDQITVSANAADAGRLTVYTAGRANKSERLTVAAELAAPRDAATYGWSASSIVKNREQNPANWKVYVSWQSNAQATNAATKWGGQIDQIVPPTADTDWALQGNWSCDRVKFNYIYAASDRFYAGGADWKGGAVVVRLPLKETIEGGNVGVDYWGLPGSSVNGISEGSYGSSTLTAVTGYKGGVVRFQANNEFNQFFNYSNPSDKFSFVTDFDGKGWDDNFGGKFFYRNPKQVGLSDSELWYLADNNGDAYIKNIDGSTTVELGCALTAAEKYVESYDPEDGWTFTDGNHPDGYGKHSFAVANGYAFVGCGKNGLRVYSVPASGTTSAQPVWSNNTNTSGVYVLENWCFSVGGAGLRIYKIAEDGSLDLYAFEVEEYDATGAPASKTAGTKLHSANYVYVDYNQYKADDGFTGDPDYGYKVYVCYGQSGVRVYNFDPQND